MLETPIEQQPTPAPQPPIYQQQPPMYPPYPYREYAAVEQPYYGQPYYGPLVLPPKKRWTGKRILLWIAVIIAILFVGSAVFAGIVAGIRGATSITPKPQPTVSVEDKYKQSATTITIAQFVASDNLYKGEAIHITGIVGYSTVTDDGMSGMIVLDPNMSGKHIAVLFPDGTKMDGFLAGDNIQIWGLGLETIVGEGETYSGMTAVYYTDSTAGISK